MLRGASRTLKQSAPLARKRLFSQSSGTTYRARNFVQQHSASLACGAVLAVGVGWYATREPIHNDASAPSAFLSESGTPTDETIVRGVSPIDGSLATLVWGSNKYVYTLRAISSEASHCVKNAPALFRQPCSRVHPHPCRSRLVAGRRIT